MKVFTVFFKRTFVIIFLSIILMACVTKQDVPLTDADRNKIPIPDSKHNNMDGHKWLQLNNGHWVEYLKIGNKGEVVVFVCGILDDSITSFSYMPKLKEKAKNGLCQLYYVNLPGNGYSSIPDRNDFDPLFLKNCLAEFVLKMKLKEFTLIGNSNGGLVSVLLASHEQCGTDFRIKNLLGFNPLLKDISFWEMDKYQKLLVKCPSIVVQQTIQTPYFGRKLVELTLRSVENEWDVSEAHVNLFYDRLSENYRCGIWSDYLKNALAMMPELKEICHELYKTISKRTDRIIFYSNPGDNWIPEKHVIQIADEIGITCKKLGNGHIPQMTQCELVEYEILQVLKLL
jgi:pimeloyl-ACP methyl ester carboxylesterase